MKTPENIPKSRIVKMSNVLVRARHGLTLSEKRLIALSITKSFPINMDKGIKITAKEFAEAYGFNRTTAYKELKDATDELYERDIRFQEKDRLTRMRWVGGASYIENEGYVQLFFNPMIFPLLFNLKEKFTQYSLESAKALKSKYSWRLMEMIERFKNAEADENGYNFWISTLEELYLTLEATPTAQKVFGQFRVRILDPAVKEINEKTAWKVKWEPIKTGRKITSIKFLFKLDEQLKLEM